MKGGGGKSGEEGWVGSITVEHSELKKEEIISVRESGTAEKPLIF